MIDKLEITGGPWDVVYTTDKAFIGNERGTFIRLKRKELSYNDANLIAAAPEMLEALIGTGRYQECNEWDIDEYILQVIEKATGRTWAEVKEAIDE